MQRLAVLAMTVATAVSAHAADVAKKIYAQELVDKIAASNPTVVAVEMHVTPPKSADNVVVASNHGHLGQKADPDDLEVISTGKTRAETNKAGDRYEVELVLLDASRRPVGALELQFAYKSGADTAALQKKAEGIRDDVARHISHAGNLMEETPVDASIPQHTFAQKLVDQAMAANPDIVIIAMHIKAPTNQAYPIVASNIGRIGKKADEDDMEVINTTKPRLEVNESGDRFESEGALRDAKGAVIGALGVVFPYKKGQDQAPLHARAEAIRGEMAKQISKPENLLEAP